ncbi:MAG: glycosyltransferase [Bacteroidales bacterium]|nr:glycosyltransferase [Bacteroidales bacterium]MBR6930556.1 glycosyltransferase [Bacteroidales bacterium]
MQHKVCFFNQSSVHYRKNIFMLMDQELSIDFYFGDSRKQGAIKELDTSCLKNFKGYFHNIGFGSVYWQNGAIRLLWSDYTDFFTTGTHYCLSAWVILLLAPLFGKRVYLWSHGAYGDERGLKKRLTVWKMKRATGSLLYGNHAKNLLVEWGVPEEKLYVFYNSLAYDEEVEIRRELKPSGFYQEHFGNNLPNLVFIGRLIADKKLDMIIGAMSLLRDKGMKMNMTYVGDGPKKAVLEALAKKSGLMENVWFYGSCYEEKQIAQFIYNADLCVSPGAIGLTAIHSMTFGTPVITHNDFSHQGPEFEAIDDGRTGTFFQANNRDDLANCIQAWLTNGLDREQIRQNCYDVIDNKYNPHRQIEMIRKVIFN